MVAGRNYSTSPAGDCGIDLAQRPHVLLAGTTGSGKSTVLRMLLSSLAYNAAPESLRLVLVDRKNEDLVPFARLPHVDLAAWTADDARRAVATVNAELQRRVEAGTGDWPRLVLVIDELAQLDQVTLDLLSGILAIGRSKRVHIVAATQHPTVKLIGDKSNYAARLVGQVTDGATAAIATGRRGTGAELLPGAGAFLYVDGAQLDRLQAYNVTHDAATGLATMIAEKWWGRPAHLPVVEPPQVVEAPVEDEIAMIGRQIEELWRNGASKNAMSKAALGRPYGGSFANKIDKAIAWLESGSTTTTETNPKSGAAQQNERTPGSSSSRTPAPILRMGAR
jgi:DNA segregation ATPase FtsK/SpoIIIE-like protein